MLATAARAGTIHSHRDDEHVRPFLYPPMLAFLVMPLTVASNAVAESVWLLVRLYGMVLFAYRLWRAGGEVRLPHAAVGTA